MKYYEVICSNGFSGCDEEFYIAIKDGENLEDICEDILYNDYSFIEPDNRFIDEENEDEYEYYLENLYYNVREITREEYEENYIIALDEKFVLDTMFENS